MDIKKISTMKVSDSVVEQIEKWILSGDVQAGDKLPSVREMCDQFGVGRSAVRDAITTLKGKGMVQVRQGEGTYVNHQNAWETFGKLMLDSQKSIEDLFTVRKMLEVSIAELAAKDRKQIDLIKIEAAVQDLESKHMGWEADYRFHLAIAEATHNDVLVQLMDTISTLMKKALIDCHHIIAADDQLSKKILKQHQQIYDMIKNKDSLGSQETMSEHLIYVQKLLQMTLEGSSRSIKQSI